MAARWAARTQIRPPLTGVRDRVDLTPDLRQGADARRAADAQQLAPTGVGHPVDDHVEVGLLTIDAEFGGVFGDQVVLEDRLTPLDGVLPLVQLLYFDAVLAHALVVGKCTHVTLATRICPDDAMASTQG